MQFPNVESEFEKIGVQTDLCCPQTYSTNMHLCSPDRTLVFRTQERQLTETVRYLQVSAGETDTHKGRTRGSNISIEIKTDNGDYTGSYLQHCKLHQSEPPSCLSRGATVWYKRYEFLAAQRDTLQVSRRGFCKFDLKFRSDPCSAE